VEVSQPRHLRFLKNSGKMRVKEKMGGGAGAGRQHSAKSTRSGERVKKKA